MGPILFVLEIQIAAVRARVFVNDVLIFEEPAGERKTTQVKVNPWIVEGSNTFRLHVAAAAGARTTPSLQVLLLSGEHGREPGPEGRLRTFRLDPTTPLTPSFADVWQTEFIPAQAFGRWLWQESRAEPPSAADRVAIRRLVERVHAALSARDDSALEQLLERKTEELSRALTFDPEKYRAGQRSFFRSFLSHSEWTLEPAETVAWSLTPLAGGRLVAVTGADGGPPLRGAAGERLFLLPITVCRDNGEWVIIR